MDEQLSEKKVAQDQEHHFLHNTALYRRSYSEGFVFARSHDYMVSCMEGCETAFGSSIDLSDISDLPINQKGKLIIPYHKTVQDKILDMSLSPSSTSTPMPPEPTSSKNFLEEALDTKNEPQELDFVQTTSSSPNMRRVSMATDKVTNKTSNRPLAAEKQKNTVSSRPRTVSHYELSKFNKFNSLAPKSQQNKPQSLKYFQSIYVDPSVKNHILRFVTEPQDMTSVECLILAHEQFISSEILLDLLLNCFLNHSTNSSDDQVVQARTLNFLKKWCKTAWSSLVFFKLVPVLEEFLALLLDNQSKYYDTLQSVVSEARATGHFQPPALLNIKVQSLPKTDRPTYCNFAEARSLDLAQQLTLIDWEFLRAVHLHELVRCRWIKDKAPTLLRASKRVNDLAYWIAFQVVTVNQLKKRIRILIKIIRLAKHLLELKSFNSLMAIYLALNFPALARLTHTWENIGKKYLQQWKKISTILSPVRNFKEYHDLTDEMTPPMILCQEILLKDLLYYEQKSQFVSKWTFNLERIYQIGSLIGRFRETQNTEFPILKSSVMYNYLLQIPDWENSEIATDVLDGQSRHIEPGCN